jgi:Glycosyl hydrolases family 18
MFKNGRWLFVALLACGAGVLAAVQLGGGATSALASSPEIVQSGKSACLATPTATVKLSKTVTAGDTLAVLVAGQGYGSASPSVTSVTDPVDGTWKRVDNTGALQSGSHYMSYAVYETTAKSTQKGLTITINQNAGQSAAGAIAIEVDGTLAAKAYQDAMHSSSTSGSISAAAAPAGELDVGLFGIYQYGQTITAGSGWTQAAQVPNCTSLLAESAVPSSSAHPTAKVSESSSYLGGWLAFAVGPTTTAASTTSTTKTPGTTSTTPSSTTSTTPSTTTTTPASTSTTTPTTTTTPSTTTTTTPSTTTTTPSTTSTTTTTTPTPPPGGFQSVGWWPGWETGVSLSSVPWNALTQISAFSMTTSTTSPFLNTTNHSMSPTLSNQIVSAAHQHGVLAILSIGGSDDQGWDTACAPANQSTFINAAIGQMQEYGYDGIELDIEDGNFIGDANWTSCLPAFHSAIDAVKTAAGKTPLLTLDCVAGWEEPYCASVASDFDYINDMNYGATCDSTCSELSSEMAKFTSRGVPASKVTLGIDLDPGSPQATNTADCGTQTAWDAGHGVGVSFWSIQDDPDNHGAGQYPCVSAGAALVGGASAPPSASPPGSTTSSSIGTAPKHGDTAPATTRTTSTPSRVTSAARPRSCGASLGRTPRAGRRFAKRTTRQECGHGSRRRARTTRKRARTARKSARFRRTTRRGRRA